MTDLEIRHQAGPAVTDLEMMLGDPLDPDNPLGYDAVVAADERGELPADGERLLAAYRLNAEFVPAALGGRLTSADNLMRRVRAVFRRDCALGIGYGVTSLIAAVPVWTAGRPDQRARLARLLLAGRRASACYTELPHGADFTRAELTARRDGGHFVLNGRKDLVNNVGRADALLVFARTDDGPGSRSHSHLLVETADLPSGRVAFGPRYPTAGVRGCQLGGVRFDDCAVPADAVVGQPGNGMETVLRAFQVTRSVLPGMMVGSMDTQLRTVTRFARGRRLYGQPVADLPHGEHVLAGAFVDLLVADCLSTVAARALHLLPGQTSVLGAAVKYLVPALLQDASYQLSVVLGARGYLREGGYAIFQKHARDLPVVTLAHASSAVCLASVVPQLAGLARQAWSDAAPAPAELFAVEGELPPLDFAGLSLVGRGDALCADLRATRREYAGAPGVGRLLGVFVAELDRLRERCAALPPRERSVTAGRASFTYAARYATVLAAAATVGVWRHAGAGTFLARSDWVTAGLARLAARLGYPDDDAASRQRWPREICAELFERVDTARSLDLTGRRLAG